MDAGTENKSRQKLMATCNVAACRWQGLRAGISRFVDLRARHKGLPHSAAENRLLVLNPNNMFSAVAGVALSHPAVANAAAAGGDFAKYQYCLLPTQAIHS
jgi:hypothetical protein